MSMLFPVAAVSAIGVVSGLILSVASKVMAVPVDEKYVLIRSMLPGANCGACGFASCDSYADALAQKAETPNNLCVPGGNQVAADISKALGEKFEEVEKKVAIVMCQGNSINTSNKMEYVGTPTCAASKGFFGGVGKCSYGCLGFGDCASVCNYGAICVKDGLAYIDYTKCVGCGMCVKTCPNKIIDMIKANNNIYVGCSSKDKGAISKKNCNVACIGCKKCERACPVNAITVTNNVAHINDELCTNCGLCASECPTKAIVVKLPRP